MNRYRIDISAVVKITAENKDDAADLLGDYLGDLGPDIHIDWEVEEVELDD